MTSGLKTFKTNFNIILSIDTKMLHALSPYCIPIKRLYAVLVSHTCFEVYPSILLDLVTQPYLKQGACYSYVTSSLTYPDVFLRTVSQHITNQLRIQPSNLQFKLINLDILQPTGKYNKVNWTLEIIPPFSLPLTYLKNIPQIFAINLNYLDFVKKKLVIRRYDCVQLLHL